MIHSISLRNFRNFGNQEILFHPQLTCISWDNGSGKSSILESLVLLSWNSLFKVKIENYLKLGQKTFFLETIFGEQTLAFSYDKEKNKKQFLINKKKVSKNAFLKESPVFCSFTPETMNMFLLAPSKRRSYLDHILSSSFMNYELIFKHYEKVLKNRNALLKSIHEWKAGESELDFRDKNFIDSALEVYRYRYILVQFLKKQSPELGRFIWTKHPQVKFLYKSKLSFEKPKEELQKYISQNRQRDIIIQKTYIWPHLDDFDILIDDISISDFASRGETKSVLVGLKILEAKFIERNRNKKPIFLIDDLSSELDWEHTKILLHALNDYQRIITNIKAIPSIDCMHTYL